MKQCADKINRLIIFLTLECNFNCVYCYVDKKKIKEVSLEELNNVISKVSLTNPIDEIHFMGGEPLIRFDKIKSIIDTFKNKFIYSLNTNGSLITDEILDYLIKNKVKIVLSVDGSAKTHNLNRKNDSFEKIVNITRNKQDNFIINYVINYNSIENLPGDIDNLVNLGFRNLDVRPNSNYLWKKSELVKLNKYVNIFYTDYFSKYYSKGVTLLIDKIISSKYYNKNEESCNELKISPDGTFFSCCRLVNSSDKYNFGKIDFDFKSRLNFLSGARIEIAKYRQDKDCKSCVIRNTCLCMIDNYYLHKSDFKKWFDAYCLINKIMIGNLLKVKFKLLKKS